ncbi:MAG: DUF2889 domain-containing protein [Gammaproteobacteria bacterium]
MPLPDPTSRELIHRRTIECQGFRRDDGLWDIEAVMQDTKTYNFPNRDRPGGEVKAGEPVHRMLLRVTVDDHMVIRDAVATTEYGPYAMCPRITDSYRKLKGIRIGKGWRRKVKEIVGGVRGCTHHSELLGPIATAAFQTIYPLKTKHASTGKAASDATIRPLIINTCHAFATDSEVVKRQWPQFYTGS